MTTNEIQPLRQGDVFSDISEIVLRGDDPLESTPHGVVLITQCCDLANAKGEAQVARLVKLTGPDLNTARSGVTARFVPVDICGADIFADLGLIGGMRTSTLGNETRQSMGEGSRRRFRERVARRFGRFAFPNELQPALRVLRDDLRQAGDSIDASEVLRTRVRAIRIDVPNTGAEWRELSITFILATGELPTGNDPSPLLSASGSQRTPKQVLKEIAGLDSGVTEIGHLWAELATVIEDRVTVKKKDSGYVRSVSCEIVEEVDYNFEQYRASADLDVDDLSD